MQLYLGKLYLLDGRPCSQHCLTFKICNTNSVTCVFVMLEKATWQPVGTWRFPAQTAGGGNWMLLAQSSGIFCQLCQSFGIIAPLLYYCFHITICLLESRDLGKSCWKRSTYTLWKASTGQWTPRGVCGPLGSPG